MLTSFFNAILPFGLQVSSPIVPTAILTGLALSLYWLLKKNKPGKFVAKIKDQKKDTIYLFTFGGLFGRPQASPFTAKIEAFLRMHNIPYVHKPGMTLGPHGKMPWMVYNDDVIPDSSFIINYLEEKFNIKYDYSEEKLAFAHGIQRMIEEHIFYGLVYDRWIDDTNWITFRDEVFKKMPWLFRATVANFLIRGGLRKTLHGLGTTRFSEEERMSRYKKDIDTLSTLLGNQRYLLGDTHSRVDATLFGFLDAITLKQIKSPLKDYVLSKKNLVDFLQRLNKELYPELPSPIPFS